MDMDTALPALAAQMTGRLSALLFVTALLAPAVSGRASRRSAGFFLAFITAHTAHYAAVVWFAVANGGRDLFPGGRSLQDVGGWLTVLGLFAFFYVLAFIGLAARRAGLAAGRWLRGADRMATILIGLQFVATYAPLVTRSLWFVAPTALLFIALVAYAFGDKVRRLPCPTSASGVG